MIVILRHMKKGMDRKDNPVNAVESA